jgi:hypothetical protein
METYTAIMMTVAAVVAIAMAFLMVLLRTMARDREAEAPGAPEAARRATYRPAELDASPRGTLSLLLLYLVVLIGIWGVAYLTLLQRS